MQHNNDKDLCASVQRIATERSEVQPLHTSAAPCSNTGRKIPPQHHLTGRDADTGEEVSIHLNDSGYTEVTRHITQDEHAPATVGLIDALAFSLVPPADKGHEWLLHQMQRFLPITDIVDGNGLSGFEASLGFGNGAGKMAWGGSSQRGRLYFSIMGKGCSLVKDWQALADWLEAHQARLTRVDVAHDDMDGKLVNIRWAVEQYQAGGFNAGGRQPQHKTAGDWLNGDASIQGRTLYVGSRANGKYCRIYEKGKQLGEADSAWTRVEVEWHGKDRLIPYDVLREPGKYLAGAYPCLSFLSVLQERIKTIAKSAQVSYAKAVENAQVLVGKLVNVMMQVNTGDASAVVLALQRDGVPGRLLPYDHYLADHADDLGD